MHLLSRSLEKSLTGIKIYSVSIRDVNPGESPSLQTGRFLFYENNVVFIKYGRLHICIEINIYGIRFVCI